MQITKTIRTLHNDNVDEDERQKYSGFVEEKQEVCMLCTCLSLLLSQRKRHEMITWNFRRGHNDRNISVLSLKINAVYAILIPQQLVQILHSKRVAIPEIGKLSQG